MDESTALTSRQRDILDAIANGAPDGSPLELVIDLDGPLAPDRLRRAVEEAAAHAHLPPRQVWRNVAKLAEALSVHRRALWA